MRSWSIPIGRLFEVEVRIHPTFLLLFLFVFATDYRAHKDLASAPRDLAVVGIILACAGGFPWDAGDPTCAGRPAYQSSAGDSGRRLCAGGDRPSRSLELAFFARREFAAQPGVGESLSRRAQPFAGLSSRWWPDLAGVLSGFAGRTRRYPPRRLHQQRDRDGL